VSNDKDKDKQITIIVNATPKTVSDKDLSYEEVVRLAFPDAVFDNDQLVFTVNFRRGHGNKPEGELVKGEFLKVKEEMLVYVIRTDKS